MPSVCTWHRERKELLRRKISSPARRNFRAAFELEFTARLAFSPWMLDGESSPSLSTSPWISPVDWAPSSVQGQQRSTVDQARKITRPSRTRRAQKQREQTELRLQFEKDRVSPGAQMRWRWDSHFFFSRHVSTKFSCKRRRSEWSMNSAS